MLPLEAEPQAADGDGGRDGRFGTAIRMAFQPIMRRDGTVFAQEALVRGPNGEGAAAVLAQVTTGTRTAFDQACRIAAIETAAALGLGSDALSINFDPNAILDPVGCSRGTAAAAARAGLRAEQILFEIVEDVEPPDPDRLRAIVEAHRAEGFRVALDDFGTMHANLDQLVELRPDVVKADIRLVRGIDADPARQAVMRCVVQLCAELGMALVAEGVETAAEFRMLRDLGVSLFQGFLLGRPVLGALSAPVMPG